MTNLSAVPATEAPITTETTVIPLSELRTMLAEAKLDETRVKKIRLILEEQIIEHPDVIDTLKPKGTTSFDEGVKVVTGFSESWNHQFLQDLHKSNRIKPEYWPFTVTWKADTKALNFLEERFPDLYEVLAEGLTTKPKKASVSVIDPKEQP